MRLQRLLALFTVNPQTQKQQEIYKGFDLLKHR